MIQSNIDIFSTESGGLAESDRTPFLLAVVIGIALGSITAGLASSGKIEMGLVPLGAIGVALFSVLLAFSPSNFIGDTIWAWSPLYVCLLLTGLGMSAGLLDTPLAAYLQYNSPIEKRGTLLSATNSLAFSGMLVTSGLLYLFITPTFEGSVSNLPASVTEANLDDEQKTLLVSAKAEFLKTPIQPEKPGIAPIVEQLPESIRPAAVTELVMADIQRRELNLSRDIYWDEFKPSDEKSSFVTRDRAIGRQIQGAIAQSGKLPLLTSRQIFLFIGFLAIPVVLYSRCTCSAKSLFACWCGRCLRRSTKSESTELKRSRPKAAQSS